ncbi:bifunctional polynucleotide phosphatase/kinase-like isoform X3 [Watersipora subatra]|uniref:bifunctional polynucleotide phosphatase/kinase-like isoform X3 n=1 Tax=Watersipora subatra TaxID=2589382 RepID=UPI00355C4F5E
MGSYTFRISVKPVFQSENSGSSPSTFTLDSRNDESKDITLGRSDGSGISDKRCSREHMRLKIDDKCHELVVQQMGSNSGCIICNGCTSTLAKHDIKRVPIGDLLEGCKICSIYLIKKDMLYEYDVILMTKGKAAALNERPSESKISIKGSSTKRQSATLDTFVIKKAKLETTSGSDTPSNKEKGEWREVAPAVHMFSGMSVQPNIKIAGFDMDGTLIITASGAKWPKNRDDWKFIYPEVPEKLRRLHKEGFKLIIFTNQGGIATGTVKPVDVKHKIEAIISSVGVPMQAFIAGCKRGIFRKPLPGMWKEATDSKNNSGEAVSLTDCIYVGDAAGRIANWSPGRKKDFSISDRLFAINCGVPFSTPEAFFLGKKEGDFAMPEFSPADALKNSSLLMPSSAKLCADMQELIIMVGFPGSGKSFFSTNHLSAYIRINRDTLGTWQKCVASRQHQPRQRDSS